MLRVFALVVALASCAAQTSTGVAADPVWSSAVAPASSGDSRLALEIQNEVTSLGALVGVAAVLDGALVFREAQLPPGNRRSLDLSTTGGRHQLCVVALYRGGAAVPNGTFVVRAPRLVDLVPGSAVTVRVSLQQQLGPLPYATAQYTGGSAYAPPVNQPDVEKYSSRLDEICGTRS